MRTATSIKLGRDCVCMNFIGADGETIKIHWLHGKRCDAA